jgi:formiminotetrahydrofolate cyclodeaminase
MLSDETVNEFLSKLASKSPTPGGGSVAALSGALGAALTSMVCNLTVGKKKYLEVTEELSDVLKGSEELRQVFTELIEKDSDAFNKVMEAYSLPKDTEANKEERSRAIEEATKQATSVPLEVIRNCQRALRLGKVVAEKGNRNSISDAGVAALMLNAASEGAALNVLINLGSINDREFVTHTIEEMRSLTSSVQALADDILRFINNVINL